MSADVWDNEIDDVTADTIFSIEAGAGGSWADYVYTSGNPGTWTVTGTHALGTDTLDLAVSVGLTVVDQPSETVAGEAIGPVTVRLRDTSGDPVVGVDVTVAEAGSYSFNSGTTTQTTDGSGIATFDNLVINTAATAYQLVFSSTVYDDETSNAFNVIAAGLNSLVIVQQPSDAAAGATIYPAVTVRALDEFSNSVPDKALVASLVAGLGTLSGTLTQTTDADGLATFDDLSVDTVGLGHVLEFGYGSVTVDSGPFDINTATVFIGATPYSAIQAAIDAASPGDDITIQAGTYTEDLTIDKSVTLTGAGATTTKITGSGLAPAVTIGDYYVTIQGLNINVPGYPGISIDDLRTNTVTIEDAVIEGNSDGGIYAGSVTHSGILDVFDCIIADNSGHGIYIELVDNEGVVEIIGNKIGAWTDADWDFPANTDDGIHIDEILHDSNVEISDNIICENGEEGIYVGEMYYGSTLTIESNTIGAYAYDGYTFYGNSDNGINFNDAVDYGCTVTIKDNDITENTYDGICIDQIGYDSYDSDGDSENATDYCELYQFWGASTVTIEGNDISRNYEDGIYMTEADFAAYLTIQDNTISGNSCEGITIAYLGDYAGSSYGNFFLDEDTADVRLNPDYPDYFGPVVLIKGNTITDNEYDGIWQYDDWEFGTSVTIEDNIITGNGDCGIYNYYSTTNDGHVLIKGNTIASNGASGGYGGIKMEDYVEYGSSYTIEDNFIGGNDGSGVYIEDVYEDGSLVIRNNTIGAGNDSHGVPYDGNTEEGIYIDYVEYSSTAEITGNVIAENGVSGGYEGIYIYEVYEEGSVSITYNDILDNDSYGINVYTLYDDGSSVVIHGNNIVGNTDYGLTYDDSTDVDATNNWWGDASGPTHADNPGGSGDEIDSDYVDYDPWLTAAVKDGKTETTGSEDVTVDAKTEADVEVEKIGWGTPTISVLEYTDNPGSSDFGGFISLGRYIDVRIDDTTGVSAIQIRQYFTEYERTHFDISNIKLIWWNGTAWEDCDTSFLVASSNPDYNVYVRATIMADTTPSLADITGTPFMAVGTPSGYSLTVHVSTTGSDVNGNGSEENPWQTIQYAIDNAWAGDTVLVHPGTYSENITIDKSLTLESDYTAPVIIDGGGAPDVIYIALDNEEVHISDFTITNGSSNGIKLDTISNGSYVWIGYCPIYGNPDAGIYAQTISDSQVTICGNEIYGTSPLPDAGIHVIEVTDGSSVEICENEVYCNTTGILIESVTWGSDVAIGEEGADVPNYIHGNDGNGIQINEVTNASYLTISGSEIVGNILDSGDAGLYIGQSDDSICTIENNFVAENEGVGVEINSVVNGSTLAIRDNTFGAGTDFWDDSYAGNAGAGLWIGSGLSQSTAEISGNIISENGESGIGLNSMEYSTAEILNNTISQNFHGISVSSVTLDSDLSIFNNTIDNSDSDGISIADMSDNGSAEIHFNRISNNPFYGIAYGRASSWGTVDATNNWWGNDSGPTHGSNPGGTGDAVSEYVDFDPWIGIEMGDGKTESTVGGTVTVDAKDEADTEVVKSGSGTPTVTTVEYTDNPGGSAPVGFTSLGNYIDVNIDDATDVDEIEIRQYYILAEITGLDEASLTLAWWDGAAWVECSNSGATYPAGEPTYRGYIWAKIRTDTTPTLAELAGTPFMPMGTPPAPTPPAPSGDGEDEPNITISLTDLVATRSLRVNYQGIVLYDSQLKTTDGKFTLDIAKNTKLLDSQGNPLESLSVVTETSPPAVPSGKVIVMAYNFGPDGASFTPAITLTATYDPQGLPQGVTEKDLYIAYWDGSQWQTLESSVNTETNTVSCQLSHFTTFAIISAVTTEEEEVVPEEEEVVPEEEEVVPEEEEVVPEEEEVVPEEEEEVVPEEEEEVVPEEEEEVVPEEEEEEVVEEKAAGLAWWIWLIVGIAAAAAIGVTVWQVMIRRRA